MARSARPPRPVRRRGRRRIDRTLFDRYACRVGLESEKQRIASEAAVHAQRLRLDVLGHHRQDVGYPPRDRLERGSRYMARARAAGEPGEDRRGPGPPPRSTESRERRKDPGTGAVLHLRCERGEGGRIRGRARGRG